MMYTLNRVQFIGIISLLLPCMISACASSNILDKKTDKRDSDADMALEILRKELNIDNKKSFKVLSFLTKKNDFGNELAYLSFEYKARNDAKEIAQGVLAFCGIARDIRVSVVATGASEYWLGHFKNSDSTFLPFESDQCETAIGD